MDGLWVSVVVSAAMRSFLDERKDHPYWSRPWRKTWDLDMEWGGTGNGPPWETFWSAVSP